MIQKLERGFGMPYEEFLDWHDVDLRYIEGPEYIGPPLEDGKDIGGGKRITVNVDLKGGTESYKEVGESPLADAESVGEIENYPHWPSPDWFDCRVIEAQCNEVRAKNRVVVFMGDRLNRVAQLKPAMYLRGVENIFMDLAMREEIARAIFRKIKEFYLVYLERILKAAKGKIDIVLTGDDFGSQNGLLISPDMWRNFIEPGFAQYISLIRKHGARAMHHTCGSVVKIIPELIGCGLDVLQSIQPEAVNMSLADLKAKFGEKLCFHGGISIQKTMPFGSAGEIRQEVKKIAAIVKPDGGYIFCTSHNIQSDTSIENVQALVEAYREYGRY
jgi:uroporphyrinogen decarboxylase